MCCSTHGVDTGGGRTEGDFTLQYTAARAERRRLYGALVQRGQRRASLQVSHHCYLRGMPFKSLRPYFPDISNHPIATVRAPHALPTAYRAPLLKTLHR